MDGDIIESADALSSTAINEHLRNHMRWDGRSLVDLRIVFARQRSGVFAMNADALYYAQNFTDVKGSEIAGDLLDVLKLRMLYDERLPKLATLFVPEAFAWLVSLIDPVETAAVNEYMCHEAGHRLGCSVQDKHAAGFFRTESRLAWPLIYMEEYRADANSWDVAAGILDETSAARVVMYTLAHRFGLAVQNLQDGQPGVGYVPFLHFAEMIDAGMLVVAETKGRPCLDFAAYDPARLVEAGIAAAATVDREINSHERPGYCDDSAEPMLRYAVTRLARRELADRFASLMLQDSR